MNFESFRFNLIRKEIIQVHELKKLLLICPMLHQGGFERVCIRTARLLKPYFDVHIVLFSDKDIAFDIDGLNIININVPAKDGHINKLINVFKRVMRLKKLKRQLNPDVAYSFGLSANRVNALSGNKNVKTWIGLRSYGDLFEARDIKLFTRKADRIICCSKEIEGCIRNNFGFIKACTLYNPYDIEQLKNAALEEVELPWGERTEEGFKIVNIITLGRDDPVKGYNHMLKAFFLLSKDINEARLMILGSGEFVKEKRLVKELGIEDKVFFAGMCKNPSKYLAKAEINLMTSINEGFPNALVEGMSLGLACVSTNCATGPAEILLETTSDSPVKYADALIDEGDGVCWGDYGVLVRNFESTDDYDSQNLSEEAFLVKALKELIEDRELLRKYKTSAAERAKAFSDEAYVSEFLSFTV